MGRDQYDKGWGMCGGRKEDHKAKTSHKFDHIRELDPGKNPWGSDCPGCRAGPRWS